LISNFSWELNSYFTMLYSRQLDQGSGLSTATGRSYAFNKYVLIANCYQSLANCLEIAKLYLANILRIKKYNLILIFCKRVKLINFQHSPEFAILGEFLQNTSKE
jgi:hypothetical protein